MFAPPLLLAASVLGCSRPDYGMSSLDLELELTSPEYGVFLGDDAAVVTGRVSPAGAKLYVDGEPAQFGEGGAFEISLPMDGLDYRMIEVEASLGQQSARYRVPVFSGHDPLESWPGAATARLTTTGLDRLGETLGAIIDASGWDTQIMDAIPTVDTDYVDFYPLEVAHEPTVVLLSPDDSGIAAQLLMDNVSLELEVNAFDGLIVVPISIGFDQVTVDALVQLELDADDMLSLIISQASIDLGAAKFDFGGLDGTVLELVVDAITGVVEPLSDYLLKYLLDQYGVVELGGPLSFETDLLGTSLAASVADLHTDVEGIGAGLGIGINEPAPTGSLAVPVPGEADGAAGAQATLAVHEGLFQLLLSDSLIDMLGSLDLSGTYGALLGGFVTALPGGDQAPDDGWCIDIEPGTAMVVRMKDDVAPLAQLHMPDFVITAGTGSACDPWLQTSLELNLDIGVVDGSVIDLAVDVPDGAVLYYGADEGTWDEDEVVAGMGTMMSSLVGLVGGLVDLDLNSLIGGLSSGDPADPMTAALSNMNIQITDSRKLYNDDGTWTEGLYVLSADVWE